jgi:HEAT repeats
MTRTSDGTAPAELERLLRAALERVVLLECRVGDRSAPADSTASPAEVERWRGEARRAEERASSAERQRDRLFEKVLEADRISSSLAGEGDPEPIDLAGFIADLRSELAELQRARTLADQRSAELQAQLQDRRPRATRPEAQARRLIADGAMAAPDAPLGELAADLISGDPVQRMLLAGALRDLESPEEWLRETACDRLGELPANLSAPLIAAAINREQSPSVLARLIRLAGRTGVRSLEPLVETAREHPDDRVRAAAVVACLRFGPSAERFAPLFADPAPRVRRRAALAAALWLPDEAPAVLHRLSEDRDPGVRQLVAICAANLPPSGDPPAPDRLSRRLADDPDPSVRRSALRALHAEPQLADESPAVRRRALRAAARQAPAPQSDDTPLPLAPKIVAPAAAPAQRMEPKAYLPVAPVETASWSGKEPLGERLVAEVRASLRGRTIDELALALEVELAIVERAAAAGVSQGRLVQRGQRLFAG